MKKVFIHCGLEKTGTSFLQEIFSKNRDLLNAHGILYPSCGEVDFQHYWLAKLFGFRYEFEKLIGEGLENLTEDLKGEIESSDCETVFISSEHFDFNLSSTSCGRLKKFFEAYDRTVILVLRNQLDYAQSLYVEYIKWGGDQSFSEFLLTTDKFDFSKRVKLWRDSGFKVAILDYDQFKNQLLDKVLHLLRAPIDEGELSISSSTKNVSPPIDFIELVRHLNVDTPREARRSRYNELKMQLDRPNSQLKKIFKKRPWGYPLGMAPKVETWQLSNIELAISFNLDPSNFLGGDLMGRYFNLTKLPPPNLHCMLEKRLRAPTAFDRFIDAVREKFRLLIGRLKC